MQSAGVEAGQPLVQHPLADRPLLQASSSTGSASAGSSSPRVSATCSRCRRNPRAGWVEQPAQVGEVDVGRPAAAAAAPPKIGAGSVRGPAAARAPAYDSGSKLNDRP